MSEPIVSRRLLLGGLAALAAGLALPGEALAQGRGWGPDGMGPPGQRRDWVPPGHRRRGGPPGWARGRGRGRRRGPPPGRGWRRWSLMDWFRPAA
jgi:hypothetical protein